ncbi:MAG: hypothetical protein ABJI41_09170 [Erythrobacter sp.]
MKKSALILGTFGLTLSGCFSSAEPVEIPEDWEEAAQICMVVQALEIGGIIGRGEGESISLEQFSGTIQYPLIASTKGDTFNISEVMEAAGGDINPLAEELKSKDHAAAVPECQKKFGIAGEDSEPDLPESKLDAAFSCYAIASFIGGSIEESVADFGDKEKVYTDLRERLEGSLESDPELFAALNAGDPEQMVLDGAKSAFAQGNPAGYLDKCVARFPAE